MHIWFFIVYFLWHGKIDRMEYRGAFPARDECVRVEQGVLNMTTTPVESETDPASAIVYGPCREVLTGARRGQEGLGRTTIQQEVDGGY